MMNGTLAEQLAKAGLASEKSLREAEAQRALEEQQSGSSNLKSIVTVEDLMRCKSIREFKKIAKEILLRDSGEISIIIKSAHAFKGVDGGKRLIGMMYALKDALNTSPKEQEEQLIRQAFRKSGGKVDTSQHQRNKKRKKK